MRKIVQGSRFKKSYKKVKKYPGFDYDEFKNVINDLANDVPLDAKYCDHELKGKKKQGGYLKVRECHICPDILLEYKKSGDKLELFLIDIGTHSNLFKN